MTTHTPSLQAPAYTHAFPPLSCLPQFKGSTQTVLNARMVHGSRFAGLTSWVEMPSWTSHLLYCNYCWHISQAYLFDESLLLCSEKEVQTYIRWLQPGLNWGEVKHEGGSGLDSPRAVDKCAPQLRWYFFHLVGRGGVAGRDVNDYVWISQCSMIQNLRKSWIC